MHNKDVMLFELRIRLHQGNRFRVIPSSNTFVDKYILNGRIVYLVEYLREVVRFFLRFFDLGSAITRPSIKRWLK